MFKNLHFPLVISVVVAGVLLMNLIWLVLTISALKAQIDQNTANVGVIVKFLGEVTKQTAQP